jgi:hypothetical protein
VQLLPGVLEKRRAESGELLARKRCIAPDSGSWLFALSSTIRLGRQLADRTRSNRVVLRVRISPQLLRAYPKTDRGGDSGDFEQWQGGTTTRINGSIRRGVPTRPLLKIPLSRRVSTKTCRLRRRERRDVFHVNTPRRPLLASGTFLRKRRHEPFWDRLLWRDRQLVDHLDLNPGMLLVRIQLAPLQHGRQPADHFP